MSKRRPKSSGPVLSEQMRQMLMDTLTTHMALDLKAHTLDESCLWDLVLYASVQNLSLDSACQDNDAESSILKPDGPHE